MNISIPPPGMGAGYAQLKARREAVEALAANRRRDVESRATETLSSGRLGAIDTAKQMARAKIEAVREKIKILKQLFGANPLGMAKALAQVFKELKGAVRDFRDATAQSMEAAGEGVRGVLSAEEQEAAGAESQLPAKDPRPGAEAAPKGLYDEIAQAVREQIGRDGLEFLDDVKSVLKKLLDMLETARTQARARKQNDATDDAFDDAGKALKELTDEMDGMSEDIRRAAPTAGMRLSVAA